LASPATFKKVRAFEGTRPQRITEYHKSLDDLDVKKIRRRIAQRLPRDPTLVAGAAAEVNIAPVGTVVVVTMAAAQMIDGLSGKGF
jgi:hypothetical protein